jgi:diadenosine tetraphosphate (Ap4A) HIT family hydrolase
METCPLCSPDLAPIIAESEHWRVVLNRNQNLLGKCFIVLRRHLESVTQLTSAEWSDLHQQMTRTTEALRLSFHPEHFNYAFLQNQDRHVHLHVIPRYASPRTFADLTFDDPDYPAHYAVPAPMRNLTADQVAELVGTLRAWTDFVQDALEHIPRWVLEKVPQVLETSAASFQHGQGLPITIHCRFCGTLLTVTDFKEIGSIWVGCGKGCTQQHLKYSPQG